MPRKCKICKEPFTPKYSSLQKTCEKAECALAYSREVQNKQWKKRKAKMKKGLKTLSDHIKETQIIVNKYVRLRDKDKPCISCDRPLKAKYDAGHYRSTQAAPNLRFNINNIHGQCVYCNRDLSGNLIEYRKRLIKRIGVEEVEKLESDNEIRKYTIEELEEIKAYYKFKINEIENK